MTSNSEIEKKTVLAIFAHPDDELGCIGLLRNHVLRGDHVIMAWTTDGSFASGFPDNTVEEVIEIRQKHGKDIAKIIGSTETFFFDLPDSGLEHSHSVALLIAKKIAEWCPDIIVTWNDEHSHPDHRNTFYNVKDAIQYARSPRNTSGKPHRKDLQLLTYYSKAHRPGWHPIYINIEKSIEAKIAAFQYYADFYNWKNVNDWVETRSRYLGMKSGCRYAERFLIRRRFERHYAYGDE